MGELRHIKEIIAEAYPGCARDIDRMVEAAGGWVCEQHPHRPWPHDDCPGPGMLAADVITPGTDTSITQGGSLA